MSVSWPTRLWGALVLLALLGPWGAAQPVEEAGPLWLSDAPPNEAYAQRLRRSHGGAVEMGRGGSTAKRLWLRHGAVPETAGYTDEAAAEGFDFRVTTPAGEAERLRPFVDEAGVGLHFPIPEEGFYNVYATRRQVRDGVLAVEVVKHELLRHLCSEGHDYPMTLVAPRHLPELPLEIIRLRQPDEDFHTRLHSGDTLRFRVLRHGQPLAGATVRLVSQRGWRNRAVTDADGEVAFELIRDYYPDWPEFRRRHRDRFLVIAEHQEAREGSHAGDAYQAARYTVTQPGFYTPPSREYRSYAYGLSVAGTAALVVAVFTYGYRRRRWNPPREEAFDERD
ncbi:hypothetical protein ACN2MM_04520 [Alkalilimnicola ehrlichii MLHE-1]|uniref:Polyferredoxin-like protein n=1 Tax=Alkalilimnicola ehrlichii (strain ATCC BAA-1101 / DSM 17681 / MLHE-1) TaxID=187272 RepID=Q0AAK0_ALKEH|nr:polyferredoxin-like protein [Alkalilimnicola ehrlichii]ABI56137.1 polyferredoxin-like protein [Alkalilimnicola ehrlichii MLHE-1]